MLLERGENVSHIHDVTDADKHFTIDPISRTITNNSNKVKLIQNDHNSERFTFECPRFVEGHDMSLCNSIRVQYININKRTKDSSDGIYEINDATVDDASESITFTWLISRNATKFVGGLSFLLEFSCIEDDGTISYAWHTDIFKDISISTGMNNEEVVEEKYPDILDQWKSEILSQIPESTAQGVRRIESLDKTNMMTIRSLADGTYILSGYFKPYDGADSTMVFSSDLLVNVVKGPKESYAQVFYPYKNRVQSFKITDSSYERKDVYLDNLVSVGDDVIISSSTDGSTKKFKITVNDAGTISATEVSA